MISRRNFLIATTTSFLSAPAIMQSINLMPVRWLFNHDPLAGWGFASRVWINCFTPALTELNNAKFPVTEIADAMNLRHVSNMNGVPWDEQSVLNAMEIVGMQPRHSRFEVET